ncbi:MAG: helix-turn-helix transcriptional regulator [Spirochaetales bacterium]
MTVTVVMHSLAVLSGAVGLGIGTFIYSVNRTLLLRHFLVFLTSLFLFVVAFFLRETGIPSDEAASTIGFFAEAIGGILQVVILPPLVYGLFVQPVPRSAQVVSASSALIMGVLVVVAALAPETTATRLAVAALLYGSIAAYLLRMIVWLRTGDSGHEQPERAQTQRFLTGFVWLSAAFLPLFVADVLISMQTPVGVLRLIDDLSVPFYFVVLSAGAIRFARHTLDRPALIEDDELTPHGRELFGLTARETEVVEYIMEGYSVADTASALKIGAKTVENHLYNVYRKTEVSNRVQLFQLFQNRRRV